MYFVWKRLRGPFHMIQCLPPKKHRYEVFDCNQAGCLDCGEHHTCSASVSTNTNCPLEQQDDGSCTCCITGLSLPGLVPATHEFFDHCHFDIPSTRYEYHDNMEKNVQEVEFVLREFLYHKNMRNCKIRENKKKLQRFTVNLTRILKHFKIHYPMQIPNLALILPHAIRISNMTLSVLPSEATIKAIVPPITRCMLDLGENVSDRPSMIIGLLYLMKSGLVLNNSIWLQKNSGLIHVLPHENSLERFFGISIKTICETENEVKLLLRQRNRLL